LYETFFLKIFCCCIYLSPLLNYAFSCGLHTVETIHQGNWATVIFSVKSTGGSIFKFANPDPSVLNTADKIRALHSLVMVAKVSD